MTNNRGSAVREFWVAVLIIVVVGGAALLYVNRQHKIESLNSQITALSSQIAKLKANQTQPSPSNADQSVYYSSKGVKIIVYAPLSNAKVGSPVAVVGEVPGSWSFEASFPIKLEDASGNQVATGTAQLLGDWMTDQLVPFSAKLTYTQKVSGNGKLVLQRDNPADLPAHDDSLSLPVKF